MDTTVIIYETKYVYKLIVHKNYLSQDPVTVVAIIKGLFKKIMNRLNKLLRLIFKNWIVDDCNVSWSRYKYHSNEIQQMQEVWKYSPEFKIIIYYLEICQ